MLFTGDDVIMTSLSSSSSSVAGASEPVNAGGARRHIAAAASSAATVSIDCLLPSSADKPLADGPIPSVACLLRLTADRAAAAAAAAVGPQSAVTEHSVSAERKDYNKYADLSADESGCNRKEDNNNVVGSVSLPDLSDRFEFVCYYVTRLVVALAVPYKLIEFVNFQ